MQKDEIKDILKENPFSTSYNLKKVIKASKADNITKQDFDLFRFLLHCRKLYLKSIQNIFKTFSELNLEKAELIGFFFKGVNKQYINSRNIHIKQLVKKNETGSVAVDMESLSFQRFETAHGNEIATKEVFERGGDVLNIFISIVNQWKLKKENRKAEDLDNQFFFDRFSEIWMNISQIYSFSSFYDILRFEKGYIIANNDDSIVKIKCSDEYKEVRTISKIGEIREASYLNEYFSYLLISDIDSKKEKTIIDYKVTDGVINPITGNKKGKYDFAHYAKYLASSGFLENEKFDCYNIELFQIFKIINVVEDLMSLINMQSLKMNIDKSLKEVPNKIHRRILIDVINKCTGISHNSIDRIINALTDKSESPYFWRKPLYQFGDYLYLSLALLSAPNYRLLLDSILNEIQQDHLGQLDRLKKYIEKEITDAGCKYQFEIFENNENELLDDCILVELKDYYLFINLFFFIKHPIESEEINHYLNLLNTFSKKLDGKTKNIIETFKLNKPATPIIIGNNNSFSGLKFNNVPFLDFPLLKNYFSTGEFSKARMVFKEKMVFPKVFNRITYYNDEKEFNKNLLIFINYPLPIFQRANKIFWKEQSVFPDGVKPKLFMDNYDFIDEENFLENEITALSRSLNFQFYNDTQDREDEIFNEHIQFYLTNIFNSLAFGKYDLSVYRYRISDIFQKSRIHGFFHLITYFTNALGELNHIKLKKDKKFKSVNYEKEDAFSLYTSLFSSKNEIRLFDFTIDIPLNKKEEKQLISLSLDYLSTLVTKKYNIDEVQNYLSFLCIVRVFKNKYNLENEFYSVCSNLISALNFDNRYQQARNLSEEILLISLENKKAYRGWGMLFLCLEQQKNVFDSTVYGCLYITSLSVETKLSYTEFVDVFYSILKFARDKPAYHLLDGVFELLKGIKLNDYDEQKIHLSYYLSIANRGKGELNKIVDESIVFFRKNKQKIIRYKDNGVFPWLNYFYNLVRFKEEGFIVSDTKIDDIINELEDKLNDESKGHLKKMHFSTNNVKNGFIESLKNVLLTYSYQDFIYEIQNLELIANHLIRYGIDKNDFDSILLSGFVFNDISLTYNNRYIEKETKVQFDFKNNIEYEHLSNYSEYIKEKIHIRDEQLILYLFDFKAIVYGLIINAKKSMEIIKIPEWGLSIMNKWLKQKHKFYFDSKKYFDLRDQEEAYKEIVNQLRFTETILNHEFEELLIATNLSLSKFPVNLLINESDFLATRKKVANILSLEWFVGNDEQLILKSNYSRTSWIPIEDADPDINFAYDKLKPIFDKYSVEAITESVPKKVIDTDVNIFLAHGELNQLGFKAIYRSDGINSAVIENKELIGRGEVAILFICNSGIMNEDLFSNSVISLVHEIILSGYKTVIAPCWSLDTSIPSFWLDEFLLSFNNGDYISKSVFMANNKLAEYNDTISNAFYVPQGRLAMHLYGNPNIKVSERI
ncbi:hypothetical protein RM553_08290 [Zunongwangia sp. F363]|uniref:CHAT domain-containing protein n=1 Tax=Autumnicola tepida TaxID=3075595 RepID=A0ABU3C922_9FLAO|nr:hypothetical protein [Zunongwangia sp. F363]MDT0642827.1 hypothetical protein [Zunongwangia sp. F363]